MKSGSLNEIDRALGLSPSPPTERPAKGGMMAVARQKAAAEAEIQSLQARLASMESMLVSLVKTSGNHSDWVKNLNQRLKKLEARARPWWKRLLP